MSCRAAHTDFPDSLSPSVPPGRPYRLHPVLAQSCLAGRPCEVVHSRTSLMSSSCSSSIVPHVLFV